MVPCALNNTYLTYRPDCSNTAIQQQGYTFEDVFDVAPDSDSDLLGQDMDVTCYLLGQVKHKYLVRASQWSDR